MVEPNDWYSTRTHSSSYTRPVAPDKKNSRLYARVALERLQFAYRGDEILHVRQDETLEGRSVADERVGRRHPLHGRVEPGEALVGEPRRDFGAVAPGERVLVGDEHFSRLLGRRHHRLPFDRQQAPQIHHHHAPANRLLELLLTPELALPQRP